MVYKPLFENFVVQITGSFHGYMSTCPSWSSLPTPIKIMTLLLIIHDWSNEYEYSWVFMITSPPLKNIASVPPPCRKLLQIGLRILGHKNMGLLSMLGTCCIWSYSWKSMKLHRLFFFKLQLDIYRLRLGIASFSYIELN